MGQKNLGCDIPNGTTQGWVCPTWMKFKMSYKLTILKKKQLITCMELIIFNNINYMSQFEKKLEPQVRTKEAFRIMIIQGQLQSMYVE